MNQIAIFIATLGPIGKRLPAPGSWGSLAALLAGAIILPVGWLYMAVATMAALLIGIWASDIYHKKTGKKDASEVIIDEVAGQWSVLLVTPFSLEGFVIAFILFRFFDILKPFPVNKAEKIEGAIGVMADDIVAGGLAAFVMLALLAGGILYL